MTYLYTYLHIFKGPKKINGIASKLLKAMQMLLIIEFMSEVIIALLLYLPFSLTGASKACRISEQKN